MTAWLPSDAATTLALWIDPNDVSKSSLDGSGFVNSITDKSANAFVFANGGSAIANTINTTTVNGNRALNCANPDGSSLGRTLRTASNNTTLAALTNAANTFACVASRTFVSSSAVNAAFSYYDGTNRVYSWVYDDSVPALRSRHGTTSTSAGNVTSAVTVETHSGTALNNYTNGTNDVTNTTAANFTMTTSVSLQVGGNDAIGWFFKGWIGDCIIYSGVLSTGDRQKLEGYLAWKWGLQGSLPAGHPYKSAAPTTGGTAYTLTAATGALTLSGKAAALTSARKVAVATGSFTLSGNAAALLRGRTLAAGTGAIALSGQSAAFPVARKVAAATGGLTLSGIAAGLSRGIRLTAAPGSFAITGQAAAFPRGRTMAAAMGAFGLTGIAAATRASRLVSAGVGAIVLTGRAAGLIVVSGPIARTLTAVTGGFTLSGLDAALLLSTAAPAGNFYPHFRRARRC